MRRKLSDLDRLAEMLCGMRGAIQVSPRGDGIKLDALGRSLAEGFLILKEAVESLDKYAVETRRSIGRSAGQGRR